MPKRTSTTHVECKGACPGTTCPNEATHVEHMRWSCDPKGISFFYYCDACWIAPGPRGVSAAQREAEEVCKLAAEGKSDAQIAVELRMQKADVFIARRTGVAP